MSQMGNFSELKNLLAAHSLIDSETYHKIIDLIPSGLACKLRLTPDNSLGHKLAHLYNVCCIAMNEEHLGFNYQVISVEGKSTGTQYHFDHDLLVMNLDTGKLTIIDCTSDPNLEVEKKTKMAEIMVDHPILESSLVHVFNPKRFIVNILRPNDLNCFNSDIFDLFDSITERPKKWRTDFFNACSEVYEKVLRNHLVLERDDLTERYEKWENHTGTTFDAQRLLQNHAKDDAETFKAIAHETGAKIYYETFEKIISQQRIITPPFYNRPAALNTSITLLNVLNSLNKNVIAKCLHLAMCYPEKWCAIDSEYNSIIDCAMYTGKSFKNILPINSQYRVMAKHKNVHFFLIKFRPDSIDSNFLEQICREAKTTKSKVKRYPVDVIDCMNEVENDYDTCSKEFNDRSDNPVSNSILGKIYTLASEYRKSSNSVVAQSVGSIENISSHINSLKLGDIINHDYEVAKSFSASLKVPPRDNGYYIGVNGPFNSITISKLSSTQDSFTTASYFVIYEECNNTEFETVRAIHKVTNNIVQGKTRTFNKNTLAYALKLPYTFISLLSWEIEHISTDGNRVQMDIMKKLITNSALHVAVNNDQFAQCAEQLRYLFTSNVGLGASSQAICDKLNFLMPKTTWEILYLFRMLKLGCSLNIIFKNLKIKSVIESGEFNIMFPNSVVPITNFSHLVSSMYYANIYNKFRSFHEVSEAMCFNELDDEEQIYRLAIEGHGSHVKGISTLSFELLKSLGEFPVSAFVASEIEFNIDLLKRGPSRFMFSISFVIGATIKHANLSTEIISNLYKVLGISPIEACSMRGAMESGVATKEHQSVRAASCMLEELIEEVGSNPGKVNSDNVNSVLFLNDLMVKDFDYSIFSAVARQFKFNGHYRYRIVQKDQKGHREISVLNSKFRLGALFCEKLSHTISSLVACDVLDNVNKDILVEDEVRKSLTARNNHLTLSDNSDQKRWGPNQLLHSFSAMFLALLRDDLGLFKIVNLVLHYGENKFAKFPETLSDLGAKTDFKSRSIPISKFFNNHKVDIDIKKVFESKFEWGMCQGIFHRTSSLYHGIMCNVVNDTLLSIPNFPRHDVVSFVTSDDAERIINIQEFSMTLTRVEISKLVHSVINNTGSLMNILRNESKSVFSAHITEFNSIFYHHGVLATPTLKQRIAKLDIGDGNDPILDYLTSISLGMGYFQNGGSYSGTVAIMLLNIVMHTEQWRRWGVLKNDGFNRPVEFGGFPVIEPFSVLYSGPISCLFHKSRNYCDELTFSTMYAESTMVPAIPVNMKDFERTEKTPAFESDFVVYKSAGPLGIIALNRTDRRLSQFERRHRMSSWKIPDEFVTLDKNSSHAGKFIFNLMSITRTSEYESSMGVNSFYLRFTDPWVNESRKCVKYHFNSVFVNEIIKPMSAESVTMKSFSDRILSISNTEITNFYDKIKRRATIDGINISNEIAVRLKLLMLDASAIMKNLETVNEVALRNVKNKNSIVKVNLSTETALDEDVFYLSLLKSVIGPKIRSAIEERTGSIDTWDRLTNMGDFEQLKPIDGLYYCTNIVQLYDKYVKRSTKLVCPGDIRPRSIAELLTIMLRFKFTEVHGLKIKHFPELSSTRVPIKSFFPCNEQLVMDSLRYFKEKEQIIKFTGSYLPMKYNVECEYENIDKYASFSLTSSITHKRNILIDATGKGNFMRRLKMWVSANVTCTLSEKTMKSLMNGELTNLHEYAVNSNYFLKNQTDLSVSVRLRNKLLFEVQECHVYGTRTEYTHKFFTSESSYYIKPFAYINPNTIRRPWAVRLMDEINKNPRIKMNEVYSIRDSSGNVRDNYIFISMNYIDKFEITTFPGNLTVFLKHLRTGSLIPVCSDSAGHIEEIDTGIDYNIDAIRSALNAFRDIVEFLEDMPSMPESLKDYIRFLLFRSSSVTPVAIVNEMARNRQVEIILDSDGAADFLRALILANVVKNLRGNCIRVGHYLLNVFRSSPYYNNGITSVDFNEHLVKDEEIGKELYHEAEKDYVDLNIPDLPIWARNEVLYTDMFSQPIETLKTTLLPSRRVETQVTVMGDDSDAEIVPDDEDDMGIDIDPSVKVLGGNIMSELSGFNFDFDDDDFLDEDEEMQEPAIPEVVAAPVNPEVSQIETVVDTSGSHLINMQFERYEGIVNYLNVKADSLIAKRRPRGYFGSNRNMFDTLRALSSVFVLTDKDPALILENMYGPDCPLFSLRVPISALSINEMTTRIHL